MVEEINISTIEELENFDLYGRITKLFDEALRNQDLIFTEAESTEFIVDPKTNLNYEIKILKNLSKRPINRPVESGSVEEITENHIKKVKINNPFLKPEPELTIINNLLGKYKLILNKFPNSKYHFLLITKDFETQESLLKPVELQLIHKILENLNNDKNNKLKYFSFFNSGPESGYSQFHKHIQFLQLPGDFKNYQNDVVHNVNYYLPNDYDEDKNALICDKVNFKHAILKIKQDFENFEEEEDILSFLYVFLVKRVLNLFKEFNINKISYNFIMMKDWMMIIPRRKAKFEEVWQNSLGFMGLFNARDEEIKKRILRLGFNKILVECGFPMEQDEELIVYNEYGY